jgi:hypothetical protein
LEIKDFQKQFKIYLNYSKLIWTNAVRQQFICMFRENLEIFLEHSRIKNTQMTYTHSGQARNGDF